MIKESKKQAPKPKKPVNKLRDLVARATKLINQIEDLGRDVGYEVSGLVDDDEISDKLCDKVLDASEALDTVITALDMFLEVDAMFKDVKKYLSSQ